jgi:hypothetical protein
MTKMTYVNALDFVLSTYADMPAEVAEKLTALRDAQVKRNASKSDKPTKAQVANMDVKSKLIAHMGDGQSYTVADLVAAFDHEYTSQKLSALLRQLILSGDVVREEDAKHRALFRLA